MTRPAALSSKTSNSMLCPRCHNTQGYKQTLEDRLLWFFCPSCQFSCRMAHYRFHTESAELPRLSKTYLLITLEAAALQQITLKDFIRQL